MVDNSNMPHPKCLGSQKNPGLEPKTCEKRPKLGFEYLPTSKTSHCVHGIPLYQNFCPIGHTLDWALHYKKEKHILTLSVPLLFNIFHELCRALYKKVLAGRLVLYKTVTAHQHSLCLWIKKKNINTSHELHCGQFRIPAAKLSALLEGCRQSATKRELHMELINQNNRESVSLKKKDRKNRLQAPSQQQCTTKPQNGNQVGKKNIH